MIHYTLLPEKEIKTLKREYRIRLAIFLLFFMSCAVFVGTGSLVPAYVFSYSQEKETVSRLESFQKDRKDRGINEVSKSLNDINEVTKRIKDYKNSVEYSKIISQIISHKSSGLSIKSFSLSASDNKASSTINVVVSGKASTRDALISFKNKLESDPLVIGVEMPVSNLTKSKDILYSLKIFIDQIL